jgi:hypothetical protein
VNGGKEQTLTQRETFREWIFAFLRALRRYHSWRFVAGMTTLA